MKETIISNCEKSFILKALQSNVRLDGRDFLAFRDLEVHFGSDYGSCTVSLGETKVIAQVSCDLAEPRAVRPNEGMMYVNIDISELVCPLDDIGLQLISAVRINRLIEKCIKESRCVDMESLCIISDEQVWELRIDITVLNADGNLPTCCSVAALASLAHFRTPQITIEDSEIQIHSVKDKEPLPLSLHHFPLLITFILASDGPKILVDPTELEEKVCDAVLIFGMNSFRELCGMHFGGRAIGDQSLILQYSKTAAKLTIELVDRIKIWLEEDKAKRLKNPRGVPGLLECIKLDRILSASKDRETLKLTAEEVSAAIDARSKQEITNFDQLEEASEEESDEDNRISVDNNGGAVLSAIKIEGMDWVPSGGKSKWECDNDATEDEAEDEESSGSEEDEVEIVRTITDEDRIVDKIELSGESEEEEQVVLEAKDMM